jgi:hypothetical protein
VRVDLPAPIAPGRYGLCFQALPRPSLPPADLRIFAGWVTCGVRILSRAATLDQATHCSSSGNEGPAEVPFPQQSDGHNGGSGSCICGSLPFSGRHRCLEVVRRLSVPRVFYAGNFEPETVLRRPAEPMRSVDSVNFRAPLMGQRATWIQSCPEVVRWLTHSVASRVMIAGPQWVLSRGTYDLRDLMGAAGSLCRTEVL